jgi:hypothetical protein
MLLVEATPQPVWTTTWFWILFVSVAGIAAISLVGQHYYKKWRKSKTPLDISYLDVAYKMSKLEEDWFLKKITRQEYEATRREYERILRGR